MQGEAPVWVTFVPFFVLMGLLVYPVSRVVRRAGFSAWWSLLALVPLGNIVGLWLLAFKRWPATDAKFYEGVFADTPYATGSRAAPDAPPFVRP